MLFYWNIELFIIIFTSNSYYLYFFFFLTGKLQVHSDLNLKSANKSLMVWWSNWEYEKFLVI